MFRWHSVSGERKCAVKNRRHLVFRRTFVVLLLIFHRGQSEKRSQLPIFRIGMTPHICHPIYTLCIPII